MKIFEYKCICIDVFIVFGWDDGVIVKYIDDCFISIWRNIFGWEVVW